MAKVTAAKLKKPIAPYRTDIRRMKVMISSRCLDSFPRSNGKPLSETRRALKAKLVQVKLFGQELFRVWINEDAPPAPGEKGWDTCMKQVEDCDLLLVLYNGNAGWTKTGGGVGICHGEIKRGLDMAPGKVRVIKLGSDRDIQGSSGPVHDRFRDFMNKRDLFWGAASTVDELFEVAEQTIIHGFADLVGWGVREGRRGNYHTGDALEWSKLDFLGRQARIRGVLLDALITDGGIRLSDSHVKFKIEDNEVLFALNAVPASLGIASAREMIGRPFLKDHELVDAMSKPIGPIHLIGCNRTVTESQARQLLGFPDATIVNAPFGVYVADNAQKIQFVLLSNCRDETTTRYALQRFREWLEEADEASDLVEHAASRKRIVQVIANEIRSRTAARRIG
ncbi:MAG: DUF4062 domain-containing protein [Xanthobacteraceae bacterium]